MISFVFVALILALILAVIFRQIKSDGYLILPKVENGKFQLNALFYIIIGFFFGIPIIGQVYPTINPTDAVSILLGIGIVFTSIYGTNTIIDAVGTYAAPSEPLDFEDEGGA